MGQKFYTHKDYLVQMKYKIWPNHSTDWKSDGNLTVCRFGGKETHAFACLEDDFIFNEIFYRC